MAYQIKQFTENDIDALIDLQPEGWGDIRPAYVRYLSATYYLPMKVEIENSVAGVGAVIRHGGSGWLGHVIVHPRYRRRGIGTGGDRHGSASAADAPHVWMVGARGPGRGLGARARQVEQGGDGV